MHQLGHKAVSCFVALGAFLTLQYGSWLALAAVFYPKPLIEMFEPETAVAITFAVMFLLLIVCVIGAYRFTKAINRSARPNKTWIKSGVIVAGFVSMVAGAVERL